MSYNNPNHENPFGGAGEPAKKSGLDNTKAQVDEVVVIMKQNVDKGRVLKIKLLVFCGSFGVRFWESKS